MSVCLTCKGKKIVFVPFSTSGGTTVHIEASCPDCKGMGKIDPDACSECNGSRKIVRYLKTSGGRKIGMQVNCPKCNPDTVIQK